MTPKKILFISHEATRTGAPIVLLNFLKWFKTNTDLPFQILLKQEGVLEPEFEAIAPVSIFHPKIPPARRNLLTRAFKRLGFQSEAKDAYLKQLKEKLIRDNIGLIYANTVTNGEILEFLSLLECPVICHVHELQWAINYSIGLTGFERVKRHTQQYIAVSKAVKKNLIENHQILEDNIELIYGFIPISPSGLKNQQQARDEICQQLNIPEEAAIVCASGATEWRKGTDLFVQLARAVYERIPKTPVYFLWVGGASKGAYFEQLWYDVKSLGLEEYVGFLGVQPNPLDYFAACDVFTLLSREEPFGMVCLEAASLGKPIVCFDGHVGVKEFVENDCGFVVPYLDIETMADKVVTLLNSPEFCQSLGQRAKEKVTACHDINVTAPKILKIIEKFLL
jgi:glycosyltransferase involved in cell wall biosynthesis